jgi:hypothetical protein
MPKFSLDQVDLAARLAEMEARREKETQERKEQRKADRVAGRPSEAIRNGLRACSIKELFAVKKICDKFIWDQRHAPPDYDCSRPYIVEVLLSISHRNQRFRLEFTRSTKRAAKVYINGPYWYRYYRDGKIVFRRKVKKDRGKFLLPRSVKSAYKKYLEIHDPKTELERARVQYKDV